MFPWPLKTTNYEAIQHWQWSKKKKCNIQAAFWRTILKNSMEALRNRDCNIECVFRTLSLFREKKNVSLRFYTAKMIDFNTTQQFGKPSRSSCSKTPTHHIVATLVIHIWNSVYLYFLIASFSHGVHHQNVARAEASLWFGMLNNRHSFLLLLQRCVKYLLI